MNVAPTHTIFVIDDDDIVRDSMKALLETRHYSVREFSSGREFLQRRDGIKADCLVVDIHMLPMNGLEVVKALRKSGDETPVLLMTGRGDAVIRAQAKALGVPLLDKPMPHAAFLAAIEEACAGGTH